MDKKKVKKKKLKKKPIIIIFILLIIIGGGVVSYFLLTPKKEEVKVAKVVSRIPRYGYVLKSNKSEAYKELFQKLKGVLSEKEVDEKEYAKVITKMFIIDFFSLGDHVAKTDIGGVEFVNSIILNNFTENAEDTYYKYVESNIYGKRNQDLPIVDKVTIDSVNEKEFTYNKSVATSDDEDVATETDPKGYEVKATWTYKDKSIGEGYQTEATFIFVHEGKKLTLVELSDGEEDTEDE